MFSRDLGQLFPQHPQVHYHTPPPSAGIVAGLGFCYAGWVLVKSLEKHQWLQRAAHRGKHCVQKIIFLKGLCWRMIIWRMVLSCQGSFKVHRVAVSRGQLPYAPSALTQIFRRRHILQASVENWNCSCFPQCLLLFQLVTEIWVHMAIFFPSYLRSGPNMAWNIFCQPHYTRIHKLAMTNFTILQRLGSFYMSVGVNKI